jgi:hypothetical protein
LGDLRSCEITSDQVGLIVGALLVLKVAPAAALVPAAGIRVVFVASHHATMQQAELVPDRH